MDRLNSETKNEFGENNDDPARTGGKPSVPKSVISYDLSPAVVCIDCSIDVPLTTKEFLLGQRAISAAQIAREGKNVQVIAHIREDVYKSYKEMYVDVTGKLPAFARAILPQMALYMENSVDYPRSTNSLVCLKPRALRGKWSVGMTVNWKALPCTNNMIHSAFSETMLTNLEERPTFSIKIPTDMAIPYESKKVSHLAGWKQIGKMSHIPKATVHKRFLLDVGSDSFFYRRLRSFMVRKFIDAFIDMVREVELCVRGWHEGETPFDESQCNHGGKASGPRIWPKEYESLKKKVDELLGELNVRKRLESSSSVGPSQAA